MMSLPKIKAIRAAALLAGCVLLVTLFVRLGPARIVSLVAALGWNFPVIVALFTAHELVRTVALRRWLPADRRPPVAELLRIRLLGEAAGALTRTGSLAAEPARAWLLANQGGQGVTGYCAAAGELLANSAASALVNILVAGIVVWTDALQGRAVVVLAHVLLWSSLVYLAAVVGIVVSRARLLETCTRAAARLPVIGHRLRIDAEKRRQLELAIGVLMERPAEFARVAVLEMSAQALLISEVYWATRSMGVAVSVSSALVMEVLTRPLTIVELVGATEMGFAMVFTWLGVPAAIGFTLSLMKTLRSLTAAAIVIGFSRVTARANPVPLDASPVVATPVLDSGG
jgi:hypothetical protein